MLALLRQACVAGGVKILFLVATVDTASINRRANEACIA